MAALLGVVAPASIYAAGCRLPAARATCPAPTGGSSIVWRAADDSGTRKHALLLRRPQQPDKPRLEFDRFVDVLWSPDGRAVAVTDSRASGESTVWALHGPDLSIQDDIGERLDPNTLKDVRRRLIVDRWLDENTLALIQAEPDTQPPRVVARLQHGLAGELTSDAHLRITPGVIGLLELPEIFGRMQMCEPTAPAAVSIYDRPASSAVTGVVRVTRVAAPEANGGCRPAEVQLAVDGREADLPMAEYAYEAPAAVVLEKRTGWFRIEMPTGSGWVRAAAGRTFHPIEALITDNLVYVTAHSGTLHVEPGGPATRPTPPLKPGDEVDVLRVTRTGGALWALVEKQHPCDADAAPEPGTPVVRGWIRLYDRSRHPTVWFYSRGC
jgi:hypothetical protein